MVEFIVLAVLLLVPVVYLVVVLGRLQAATFAVDGAAREAARAYVAAPDEPTARGRVLAAVRLGLFDQGFDVDPARAVRVRCSTVPCLTPGARVTVTVSVQVVLPGVPGFVDRVIPTRVGVRSSQVATVDAYRVTGAVAVVGDAAGAGR